MTTLDTFPGGKMVTTGGDNFTPKRNGHVKATNWQQFDNIVGRDAYLDLDNYWRRVVSDLSEQHADPDTVYERYTKRHPTREATARIIKQALVWRLAGGSLEDE